MLESLELALPALRQYVHRRNAMARLFDTEHVDLAFLTKAKAESLLASLDCDLSPENLTCDGELSRAQVSAKLVSLTKAKAELRLVMGREGYV